tara:strand:+ start:927 stop:1148 length:222 start_codon:yes stop_codon:yes gene_type:complete
MKQLPLVLKYELLGLVGHTVVFADTLLGELSNEAKKQKPNIADILEKFLVITIISIFLSKRLKPKLMMLMRKS